MKILVGIATVSPDRRFLSSLSSFANECGRRFPYIQMDFHWVWDKPLVDAQNEMAEKVLEGNYDYLLTIEDDHHGFTADMLLSCLDADTFVCGISYRSRHMPFIKLPLKFREVDGKGIRKYDTVDSVDGYVNVDLISFGFTLISKEVFQILDRPFFRLNQETYPGVGPRATDIDFSNRLLERKIPLVGCFDYILPHRDIEEDKYQEIRATGCIEKQSMFTMLYLNSRKQRATLTTKE